MKRLMITLAVMMFMAAMPAVAQNYGIVFGDLEVTEANADDIFGDGMASYNVDLNMLMLQDGFNYHLSHGLVTIDTGQEFRIVLGGRAEFVASLDCKDAVIVETEENGELRITSNISGSALRCKKLSLQPNVSVNLLSRNSQTGMYALECGELEVNNSLFYAEVTTAELAVATQFLKLYGCWLQKPAGGSVNEAWGGICYADGTPAKIVRISVLETGVPEEEDSSQSAKVEKIFEHGQIVIIKDGKRYDVTGREVPTRNR